MRDQDKPQPPMDYHFINNEWRERLTTGSPPFPWSPDQHQDRAILLKQNALRRVWKLDHNNKAYFLKQHSRRGWTERLKHLFLGSPAAAEYKASLYADQHNIPAVLIVAHAERADDWNPHLSLTVSPAIDNVQAIADAFTASHGHNRTALIHATAQLVAKAHNEAFLHPDSHPGNILVAHNAAGEAQCCYVDLFGARCGRPVTKDDAARNLAALHQWFRDRATRTDKQRFLYAYLTQRSGPPSRSAMRTLTESVAKRSTSHAHSLYRKRDRRIGRSNAYFARKTFSPRVHSVVTLRFRDLDSLLPIPLPQNPVEDWTAMVQDRYPNPETRSPETPLHSTADTEVYFTCGWRAGQIWPRTAAPAWLRYRTACMAMNRDLPTVAPRAYLSHGQGLKQTWAAWTWIAPTDALSLLPWLRDNQDPHQRQTVLERIGHLIADTCQRGLAITNLSLATIGLAPLTCRELKPFWQGIEAKAFRSPAPRHVGSWMLDRLAQDAANRPESDHRDHNSVVAAFKRRYR